MWVAGYRDLKGCSKDSDSSNNNGTNSDSCGGKTVMILVWIVVEILEAVISVKPKEEK